MLEVQSGVACIAIHKRSLDFSSVGAGDTFTSGLTADTVLTVTAFSRSDREETTDLVSDSRCVFRFPHSGSTAIELELPSGQFHGLVDKKFYLHSHKV